MSLQIFLHGKILGIEEFLRGASGDLSGRAQWATLLGEVLPRALLAEFRLAPVLLGSSGGGQFLLLIPEEIRADAEAFCRRSHDALQTRTGGTLSMVWSATENLGDWSDIRKRLLTDLYARMATPAQAPGAAFFADFVTPEPLADFPSGFREGSRVGWSPDAPADLQIDGGRHVWTLGHDIPFAAHSAPDDADAGAASVDDLASRANGRWVWGVLRGDVDDFGIRLRRSTSVEEHLQLSMMFKQFFAGELQMRCSLPEFWRKVSLLYSGGQDFAVVGAWDALIGLAREVQRLFALFADANLKEHPGPEGKTISMAIALARHDGDTPESVFAEAGDKLRAAKTAGRDSVWVLGRTLEWKQLADAAESRVTMTRLIREYGVSPQLLDELAALYRDSSDTIVTPGARRANARLERPWRFYRRLDAMLGSQPRGKDFTRLRSDLISDFTGRRASNVRLRPQGRVALEWARLESEAI
jgi:CRISPR-associated protein Csm1